jgi:hypothetical protein
MATIIIKNSTGSGAIPSSLQQGELAINTKDGRLFYGSGSGNIVKEFTGSGGGSGTTFPYTGSAIISGSLVVTGSITSTGGFTGSLFGTASWANNATSASIAGTAVSADTGKTVLTVANSTNADFYPTFVDSNNTPSAASEVVYTSNRLAFNPSTQLLSVSNIFSTSITASRFTGSFTGSLLGTASYANQALSASYAPSAATFPYTGSAIISGSLVVTGSLLVGVPGVNSPAIDSTAGTLGRGTQTKIDWINAYLQDSSVVLSVDWENRALHDSTNTIRVDWAGGGLNDAASGISVDWENRFLHDSTGIKALDYNTRNLIYPNGTTTAINYGTQDQISMTGSVSVTGSFVVSGSSTFRNIGPAEFTGSVSSLNGFTGSLQGTASYATNALTASFLLGSVTSASYAATASNILPAITNNTNDYLLTATGNGSINGESLLTFDGTKLSLLYQSGDEGGEILLNKSVTNNSLTGSGITIDSYQNKLRFFEQGGAARGAYIDLTACAGGVGTNLAPIRNIQSTTDGTAVTGTTSGTLTTSILIPANTVGVNDVIYVKTRIRKTGTAGTVITRMYVNTSAAIGGSLIATSATAVATTLYFQYSRTLAVKSTTNTETMAGNLNVNADDNTSVTTAVSANNIDWTVDQYLVVAVTNSSTADSSRSSFVHLQINKA